MDSCSAGTDPIGAVQNESSDPLTVAFLNVTVMGSLRSRAHRLKERYWLEEDPDDLMQEAFTRTCAALKKGYVLGNLTHARKFLYKKLSQAAIDSHRKRRGLPPHGAREAAELFFDGVREAEAADLNARLDEYIRSLPPDKQLICTLAIEGVSQAKISERVRKSESQVSRDLKGIRKLVLNLFRTHG